MIRKNMIKKISLTICAVFMLFLITSMNTMYANGAKGSLIAKLSNERYVENSSGSFDKKNKYWLNNARNKVLFQILSVASDSDTAATTGNNYYCLNGDIGASWVDTEIGTRAIYTDYYDMVSQQNEIKRLEIDAYKEVVSSNYTQLLWVLDHLYSEGGISTNQLLNNAGFVHGQHPEYPSLTCWYYKDINAWPKSYNGYYANGHEVILSTEEIQAIQQAAIWHFTNNGSKYDFYTNEGTTANWFRFDGDSTSEGKMKQEQAAILYNYFIDGANKAARDGYTSTSTGTVKLEYTNSNSKIIKTGDNYKIGPLKVTTTGNTTIKSLKVTTGTNKDITGQTTIKNSNGDTITKVEEGKEFYIVVPISKVEEKVKINVSADYYGMKKTLWIKDVTNEEDAEQPLVEYVGSKGTKSDEVEAVPEREPQFDLALRKIITKVAGSTTVVNENGLDAKRKVTVDNSKIPDTATYKHRKDPIVVKTGNIITYEIRLYNEGEIDGYATTIIDQLPSGLKSTLGSTVTSSLGNKYRVEYNTTTNQIKLIMTDKVKAIKAYDGNTLSSETIQVTAEVIQEAATDGTTKHYLTNVAYIAEEYDAENNKTITADRDGNESKPTVSPNKTATELNSTNANSYKGNSSNGSVLTTGTNNDYYFEGEEDDDDFEKVVVLPKTFDLKLMKFISAINHRATTRSISIDSSKLNKIGGKTTADYDVSKVPLKVEKGDIVTYTLRIYNEGEIDGYASEISENIPDGLRFENNLQNNSRWTASNDGKTITTNYLSKNINVNKLIKAFNSETDDGKGSGLSYQDVTVDLRVITEDTTKIIRNEAAITEDTDKNGNPVNDRDSDTEEWKKQNSSEKYENNDKYPKYKEDDEDYDNIKLILPDFSLRKFITKVSSDVNFSARKTTTYNREPEVVLTNLKNGTSTTAIYNHSKEPIFLNVGDYVLYTIRVYNEGEAAGYIEKITDYLPNNLDFVEPDEVEDGSFIQNINKNWQFDETTRHATFSKTPRSTGNGLETSSSIAGFDKVNGTELSSLDYQIVCRVNNNAAPNKKITNIAEITEFSNLHMEKLSKDIDSTPDNLEYPSNPETYKDSQINAGDKYIPGQEDDDDFEKVIVRKPGTYNIVLVKEDKDGEQLNSTATFEVNGESKTVKGRLTIAENVEINGTNVNTPDVYTIKETKAPDEYCEFGGTITVTANKKADGTTYKLDSVAYEIRDTDGNEITTSDAKIYIKNGNIFVEVIDYEQPEIHKGVKTVENQDSGYNKDEQHTWAIRSDIPEDIARYKKYEIVDDIDYRLNYVENSVVVKIGNTTLQEETDYKVEYTKNANGITDKTNEGTLKITFIDKENGKAVTEKLKTNAGKKINVTYKTTFAKDGNGNLLAELGTEIPNQAKLEYKNTANISGEKETEIPEIHTGGVSLYKYYKLGTDKKSLQGAEFSIYKTKSDAENKRNVIMQATSGEDGIVRFIGLEYGEDASDKEENKTAQGIYDHDSSKQSTKYWVVETKAPNKFELSSTITEVTVNSTSYKDEASKITYQIENRKKPFDLKLIKYISAVNDIESNREIKVDTKNLNKTVNGKKVTTADYDVTKVPLTVQTGDIVTYTFRVYNEGELAGYASEITEDIPEGLEYDASLNTNPEWTVSNDGKTISTDYLADKLIKAFDGQELDYKEVSVKLKVTAKDSKKIVRNEAEISKDKDEDGEDVTDRDSIPEEWKKENSDDYYEDNENYPKYKEDDEDYDNIKVVNPDLALRKFIEKVSTDGNFNNSKSTETYVREPQIDSSKLKTEKAETAIYNHSKKPIYLFAEDYILYTIRVYNEGEVAGYASQIIDYLPQNLDFVDSNDEYISRINNNWEYDGTTRKVTTKQTAPNSTTLLKAFDSKNDNGKGSGLSFVDVQIVCKVNKNVAVNSKLTNIAEISEYKNGNEIIIEKDRDSSSRNIKYPENPSSYKDDEINKNYVPGQEDDDDFEKVIVREPKKFDLALRKFITNISGKDVTSRIPQVNFTNNKITYTHPKDVLKVVVGDTVTYTLRVFNEGEIDGFAEKVTDDIPTFLEYLPENSINKKFRWVMYDENGKVTSNVKDAVKIVTDYTSKENGELLMKNNSKLKENPNLLKAFNVNETVSATNPSFVDVKVAFKVKDPNSNKYVITNRAQISEDADEEGKAIDDIDSTPDRWKDGEDDQDYENVSVEYFDLSLLKYVTKAIVTENGKTKTTKTGNNGSSKDITPKVEIYRKSVYKTIVKFEYTIKVTNEGDIAGYAKELTDYVPSGLKFYSEDNTGWKDEGNNVISTRLLKDTLLKPGQSATVKVILRWINGESNLGVKTNIAEISEDYNDKKIPDRDSTPDNKKPGEDDIDDAPVLLTISTGMLENPIAIATGALVILVVLGLGVVAIKKYVL